MLEFDIKTIAQKREEQLNKDFIYLEGLSKGIHSEQLAIALAVAKRFHINQKRRSGESYLCHPVGITMDLVNRGILNEIILSTALLHDVLEDCDITFYDLIHKFGISEEIVDAVILVTKTEENKGKKYLRDLQENPVSCIVKLADRLHNLSTMFGAFKKDKIERYVKETIEDILPMGIEARKRYPKYRTVLKSLTEELERFIYTISYFLVKI